MPVATANSSPSRRLFAVGQVVRDRQFGTGTVIRNEARGEVLVDFPDVGRKLVTGFYLNWPTSLPALIPDDPPARASEPKAPANDNTRAWQLSDWTSDRFAGEPAPVDYLVSHSIAKGEAGMVAAMGEVGKTFTLLELERRVAFGESQLGNSPILGGQVVRRGTAVFITSEDSEASVHRRLAALDVNSDRTGPLASKLIIVPLPSAGGPFGLWKSDRNGLAVTDQFLRLREQLSRIRDLELVALDPLSSFAHLPINEDPVAGQFVCSSLAGLAADTGASVLVAHHMRKLAKPIEGLADARDAVRGTTALVDGVRLLYTLWPADDERAKRVCKELRIEYRPGSVVLGGIAKANGPVDRRVATYVRDHRGLLIDRSIDLKISAPPQADLVGALVAAIGAAAEYGQPFTKTGAPGLFEQRNRLPPELASLSRARLEGLADTAVATGAVVTCAAKGSSVRKHLDVPGGQFAIGLGDFRRGA